MIDVLKISGHYSDPHFGHRSMISKGWRPFSSLDEMHEFMIAAYNAKVKPSDTIVWHGDCFFMSSETAKGIMDRLNGTKVLIPGNHDDGGPVKYFNLGFSAVFPGGLLTNVYGKPARLAHFPYKKFWPNDDQYADFRPLKEPGIVLLHGHTHQKERVTEDGAIHVGCDAWDHGPVLFEEVAPLVDVLG